jgi:hypothetical protein
MRLKHLDQEINSLKAVVAERDLEIELMKGIVGKSGERTDSTGAGPICDWSTHQAKAILNVALSR